MTKRGDGWRFWLPAFGFCGFFYYVGFTLTMAHLRPEVQSINARFVRDLPATRGSIIDVTRFPMAKSIPVWSYHLDPVDMTYRVVRSARGEPPRTREAIAYTIARALKLDYAKVRKMAKDSSRRYQLLGISTDSAAHDILANSKLVAGVSIEDHQVRQYLHGRLMSHVLGSVNAEGVGSAGVELKYGKWLTGTPGRISGMKDALGRELYDRREVSIEPVEGARIQLTLDHNLQFVAERELCAGITNFHAGAGWCIIMKADTGAILAMASYPDFDPEQYRSATDREKINRCISFNYEPGSVMKVITASSAIDAGVVKPATTFSTDRFEDGYYRLPGDGSHVWEPRMSVRDGVVHSSNIVIGKLGVFLGREKLWAYMREFGFGVPTRLGLPGEEAGILPHWKDWDMVKWSRAPIGQGISVTAIQLVSAYQAIANDGVRLRPYLVECIEAADGTELYRHHPEVVSRPIKPATAKTMREVMLGVATREGTARRAAITGYSIAGKTGTAEKAAPNGKGYQHGLYCATFCGMVPASDPKLVVLVTLDFDTRQPYHQGGNSAAPVWQRITKNALQYLMIPPDSPEDLAESEFLD